MLEYLKFQLNKIIFLNNILYIYKYIMNGIINFETSINTIIMIRSVSVIPKQGALIKLLYVDGFDVETHKITIEGEDYQSWGFDDDFLGHYCINKLTNGKATIVNSNYVAPSKPDIINDNRSIHNEADIQKIQTLQEQLDAQAAKLKTITDMLIGKGLV